MRAFSFVAILLFLGNVVNAQHSTDLVKKGSFYIAWGWNRAYYSNSDITFKGNDFDFTLKQVKATDDPSKFKPRIHLNPFKLTIPQTNFRLGYYINEKYSVCFGFDHMKYVMVNDQHTKISGTIKNSGTEYDGTYDNDDFVVSRDFLEYENTDGLNYVHFELNRQDVIYRIKKTGSPVILYMIEGVSAGGMYPRTDSHLLNYRRNNQFHVTGFGTGLKGGLRLELFKHFFIQSELKGGYINMQHVKPTEFHRDNASQHFFYTQTNILFGGIFRLFPE